MTYKIAFDAGKPYEITVNGDEELKQEIQRFYHEHQGHDYPFDARVYDGCGNDITESQFVAELIGEIVVGGEV